MSFLERMTRAYELGRESSELFRQNDELCGYSEAHANVIGEINDHFDAVDGLDVLEWCAWVYGSWTG